MSLPVIDDVKLCLYVNDRLVMPPSMLARWTMAPITDGHTWVGNVTSADDDNVPGYNGRIELVYRDDYLQSDAVMTLFGKWRNWDAPPDGLEVRFQGEFQ